MVYKNMIPVHYTAISPSKGHLRQQSLQDFYKTFVYGNRVKIQLCIKRVYQNC